MTKDISNLFANIKDPRIKGRCLYALNDILFIACCTLLSHGEDFEDMVEFGQQRLTWLRTFLDLPHGIPSHDTFNRVLQIIDPKALSDLLVTDGQQLLRQLKGQHLSIDGKKIKGVSPKSRGNTGFYILSAWVNEQRLCIGQEKVATKSNEITAIPKLLAQLDIQQTVVSIDAIGCQKNIAAQIIDQEGDYLLAVKANQKQLFEEVQAAFEELPTIAEQQTWEYDHGRYEERHCSILPASKVLTTPVLSAWKKATTLVRIQSIRQVKDKVSQEVRYYISSEDRNVAAYNKAVRGHWGIENHLHWHLDVTFKEDSCRARSGHAAENLNSLRKFALQRLTQMKDKRSLQKRRYRAALNKDYLVKILTS